MQAGSFQKSPVHGHFRPVTLKTQIFLVAAFQHGLQQHPPRRRPLAGQKSPVQHFVLDLGRGGVGDVRRLRQGGAAPARPQLGGRIVSAGEELPAAGFRLEGGGQGVLQRITGSGQTFPQLAAGHPIPLRRRVVQSGPDGGRLPGGGLQIGDILREGRRYRLGRLPGLRQPRRSAVRPHHQQRLSVER